MKIENDLKSSVLILINLFLQVLTVTVQAQEIDLLLKHGHVVDPANNINAILDVAITNGKIITVAPGIPADRAKKVIDASGLICLSRID